jgi:hypothetical protein
MHVEDRDEATTLTKTIEEAVAEHNRPRLVEAVRSLKELLFFVEGS